MMYNDSVRLLALYYGVKYEIDFGGETIVNPPINYAEQWLRVHFQYKESLSKFCEQVMKKFKPTATTPFPTLADLEEIHEDGNQFYPKPYQPEIETKAKLQIEFEQAVADYNQVHRNPPENLVDVTVFEILEDAKKLSAYELMKKYGVAYAADAWIIETQTKLGALVDLKMSIREYRAKKTLCLSLDKDEPKPLGQVMGDLF